ncbi:MAG: hypothetical protein ACREH4_03330 [Vitreimonas sp.]
MTEELFRDFWWLIFPIFGMVMAVIGYARDNTRDDAILRNARERLERKP